MGPGSLRDAVAEAAKDPAFLLISEERGIRPWTAAAGERSLWVPVTDRGAFGLGLGLALAGRTVLVAAPGRGSLIAAWEILAEAAALHARSPNVRLIVHAPHGREAGREDRSVPEGLQGVTWFTPRDGASAGAALTAALEGGGPAVVLDPRVGGEAPGPPPASPSIALVAIGSAVGAAQRAAGSLASVGRAAAVHPIDRLPALADTIVSLTARVAPHGRIVVIHPDEPALARDLAAALTRAAFLYLECPPALVSAHGDVGAAVEAALAY